jgi:hypothetical protein
LPIGNCQSGEAGYAPTGGPPCARPSDSKKWIARRRGGAEKKTPRLSYGGEAFRASARDIFACSSPHKEKFDEGENPNARSGHRGFIARDATGGTTGQTACPADGNTLLGDAKRQNRKSQSNFQARAPTKPPQSAGLMDGESRPIPIRYPPRFAGVVFSCPSNDKRVASAISVQNSEPGIGAGDCGEARRRRKYTLSLAEMGKRVFHSRARRRLTGRCAGFKWTGT